MKTIEERAKEFCENNICVDCEDRKNCDRGCVGCSISTYSALEWLIQFGKSEHAELMRWHDPKEELPEYVQPVAYKFVSELPMTPVGKVDYRKLEAEITPRDY